MKTIKKVRVNYLVIALMAYGTINCKSQIKTNEKNSEQATIEYPEAKLVYKDEGTKNEELQGELQIALGNNDIEEISIVLGKGASANKLPGNTDMTPIMLAETQEIAQLLIKNGANPLVIDVNGQNLLHYAVSKENAVDLILLYVSLAVDINARDREDNTPTSLAIDYYDEANAFDSQQVFVGNENYESNENEFKPNPNKTLNTLVKAGADLNTFNKYGYTLLMNCVTNDNPEIVKILLELGADKSIQNKYGQTAKDIAYKAGHRHVYQLLEEKHNIQINTIYEKFENINAVELNQMLAKESENLTAQEVMKLYYPKKVDTGEGNEKIEISENILDNGNTVVILIHDNLLDDSVKGEKYLMELKKTNGKWKVFSIKKNWKCWIGRGHTDWGIELCR